MRGFAFALHIELFLHGIAFSFGRFSLVSGLLAPGCMDCGLAVRTYCSHGEYVLSALSCNSCMRTSHRCTSAAVPLMGLDLQLMDLSSMCTRADRLLRETFEPERLTAVSRFDTAADETVIEVGKLLSMRAMCIPTIRILRL